MYVKSTNYYFIIILIIILILIYFFNWYEIGRKENFQYNTKLDCGININSVNIDCPNYCSKKLTDTDLNNNVYLYCLNKHNGKLPEKDIGRYFFDDKISDGIKCPDLSYKDSIKLKGQNSVYSICVKKQK